MAQDSGILVPRYQHPHSRGIYTLKLSHQATSQVSNSKYSQSHLSTCDQLKYTKNLQSKAEQTDKELSVKTQVKTWVLNHSFTDEEPWKNCS